MSVAFWSVTIAPGKTVEVQPPEGFVLNLQQAALVGATKGAQVLKVKTQAIEGDDIDAVIGTLRPVTADQINLSLVFGYDVPAVFSTSGDANGTVHLTGYYQPGPDDDEEGDEEDFDGIEGDSESDSEDDESDGALNTKLVEETIAKLKAAKPTQSNSSKGKVVQLPSEDEESSEDEKMIKKNFVSKPATPAAKKGPAPAPDSEEDSEEEEEEEDSEEGSEDGSEDEDEEDSEEDKAPPVKIQKVASKGIVTNNNQNNKAQQKPASAPAGGQNVFKSNNNTPNKSFDNKPKTPQAHGSGGKPFQQGGNKTPQQGGGGNKNNHNSGNKFQQSGDKRKR